MSKQVRVLVVDDNRAFARAATRYLARNPRVEVLPAAVSAQEALQRLDADRPDLVVMDVNMPVMDGLEATSLIKQRALPPKIVAVSLDAFPERVSAALSVGADAFLSKSALGDELNKLIDRMFGLDNPS